MPFNEKSLENLKKGVGNVFTSTNQPERYKSGNTQRATYIRRLSDLTQDELDARRQARNATNNELIAIALIDKAKLGDVKAIELYLDSCYGKIKEVRDDIDVQKFDYSILTPQELEIVANAQRVMVEAMNRVRNSGIEDAEVIQ